MCKLGQGGSVEFFGMHVCDVSVVVLTQPCASGGQRLMSVISSLQGFPYNFFFLSQGLSLLSLLLALKLWKPDGEVAFCRSPWD